ncbi:MAG: SEC-C metal-binding domain-containing protein [Desulfopila sp.]
MKIGRNEACPCGSGKKYKRCCADKAAPKVNKTQPPKEQRLTLGDTIAAFQEQASQKNEVIQHVGVFLFYADGMGDAWVLELTDSDCIQIAAGGRPLEVPLEETEETIVMDWSHSFSFKNKALQVTSHKNKTTEILANAPSQKLAALRRKILKKISPELLDRVHVDK